MQRDCTATLTDFNLTPQPAAGGEEMEMISSTSPRPVGQRSGEMQFTPLSSRDCLGALVPAHTAQAVPQAPSPGSASLLADEGGSSLLSSQALRSQEHSCRGSVWFCRVCSTQGLGFSWDAEPGLPFTHSKVGAVPPTLRGTDPSRDQRAQARSSSLPCSCCGDATEQGQARVLHLSAAAATPPGLAGLPHIP